MIETAGGVNAISTRETGLNVGQQTEYSDLTSFLSGPQAEPAPLQYNLSVSANQLANPATLGERMLSTIETMRGSIGSVMQRVETDMRSTERAAAGATETARGQDIGQVDGDGQARNQWQALRQETAELLSLQLDIGKIMVQENLLAQVVGKSSSNLQTLLRGQ